MRKPFGKGIALDLKRSGEFLQKLIDEFDIRPAECADHQQQDFPVSALSPARFLLT